MLKRLLLLRHGEVTSRGTYYGHLDLPLSPAGQLQARRAAEALRRETIDAVYSSDLQRAAIGARLIGDDHRICVIERAAFREMNLGVLEGRTLEDVERDNPGLGGRTYAQMIDYAFPGGETLRDVASRALAELSRIADQHAGKTVALVAHNSVNRLIITDAQKRSIDQMFAFGQAFGCINVIDYGAQGEAIIRMVDWAPPQGCVELPLD